VDFRKRNLPKTKQPIGVSVYDAARQRIAEAFDLFERIYVSFSAGKDSTVMLHMVCEEALGFAEAFGGFKEGARVAVSVFEIGPGCYAYFDDRGVFEVDYDTDTIVAYARITHRYEDVDPHNPDSATSVDPDRGYAVGGRDKLAEMNEAKTAPIGEVVPTD